MEEMTIISLVLAIVAIIPFGAYFVLKLFYTPKVNFRISGEQTGDTIVVAKNGRVYIAVYTDSDKSLSIEEVWVQFNPDEVNLYKTSGAEQRTTLDKKFPVALLFSDKRAITKDHLQANYFDYEASGTQFTVKIIAEGRVDERQLPFLLDIYKPSYIYSERVVVFQSFGDVTNDIRRNGLKQYPKEVILIEGKQSQESVMAATDSGTATLKIYEAFDK